LSREERRELREAALTIGPALVVALVLRWALVAHAGWIPRRAMLAGVGTGIALAVLVLRSLRRPRGA
jgi:CHASE2 domain-containing sensor protein